MTNVLHRNRNRNEWLPTCSGLGLFSAPCLCCVSYFIDFVLCPPLWFVICYSYTIPSDAKCVFSVSCFKLIFSSAGKWFLLLRGEWRYFISHRRGFEARANPGISSLLWEQWGSDGCTLLPLSRTGQWFLLPACFSPLPGGGRPFISYQKNTYRCATQLGNSAFITL